MTLYCQHTFRLRLVRPGQPEVESERPRDKKTEQFLDGLSGTQVEVPSNVTGFNVEYALQTGAIAPLPCAEHPEGQSLSPPAPVKPKETTAPKEVASG